MNSQYFCDVGLEATKRAVIAITGESGIECMIIHMDNRKGHYWAKMTERLEEFEPTGLFHPPYSPEISPCDFWFFVWSKNEMRGQQFRGLDDVRVFLSDLWRNLDLSRLILVYHEWITRLEQAIAMNGDDDFKSAIKIGSY
jgi:histone-lysine N-methyltransferase SETMAR